MFNKSNVATFMKNVAKKSAQVASDNRCMYILHQPKQPKNLKKLMK